MVSLLTSNVCTTLIAICSVWAIGISQAELLGEFTEVDRIDVADMETIAPRHCRVQRFGTKTIQQSQCWEWCHEADSCVAATSYPTAREVLRSVEANEPFPILSDHEQGRLCGLCATLICHQPLSRNESHHIADALVASRRRAQVQPHTIWRTTSLVLQRLLKPTNDHISLHFLMLSSPQHFKHRLIPALRTHLRRQRVSVFSDVQGDGLESHQREEEFTGTAMTDMTVVMEVARHCGVDLAMWNVTCPQHMSRQRQSINGAWKPLVLLLFANERLLPFFQEQWFVWIDDDTFLHIPNMVLHLRYAVRLANCDTSHNCHFALGENSRYAMLLPTDTYASPAPHAPEFVRLNYLQGGGGVVMSSAFLGGVADCLLQLRVATTTGDEVNGFVVSSAYDKDGPSVSIGIMAGFADAWPAGDMRVSWAVAECRRLMPHTFRLQMLPSSDFSHRSLELSLGSDRRHWVGAYPVSFHRCRTEEDFERIQFTFGTSDVVRSWRVIERRLSLWWTSLAVAQRSLRSAKETHDTMFRSFYDDNGFA